MLLSGNATDSSFSLDFGDQIEAYEARVVSGSGNVSLQYSEPADDGFVSMEGARRFRLRRRPSARGFRFSEDEDESVMGSQLQGFFAGSEGVDSPVMNLPLGSLFESVL